jgi:predicted alpha/beta hydrolase
MPPRELAVGTADGCTLEASLYEPEPESANGAALLINSAAATPRRYYAAFAGDMARRGFAVATYDYRDAFITDPEALRRSTSSMSVWGLHDQTAMIRQLRSMYPERALVVLGHSMGGQLLGLSPAAAEVSAALLIGTAQGYWLGYRSIRQRLVRARNIFFAWPLALRLQGYLPAAVTLGAGPRGPAYAREFLRFCRSPHFFCDERGAPFRPHNAELRCPLKYIVLADDEVVEPGAQLDVREYFPNAEIELQRLTPQQYGVARLGHLGLFRRSMQQTAAWADIAAWFERKFSPTASDSLEIR